MSDTTQQTGQEYAESVTISMGPTLPFNPPPAGFQVKDSGERQHFASGMVRDITTGKIRYDLVFDGPMFKRFAQHITLGAVKYSPRNWMQASSMEEAERFKESAIRHFIQWLEGDTTEDHAAAVYFNVNGYEYVMERIRQR